jgi:hypothetical protein
MSVQTLVNSTNSSVTVQNLNHVYVIFLVGNNIRNKMFKLWQLVAGHSAYVCPFLRADQR